MLQNQNPAIDRESLSNILRKQLAQTTQRDKVLFEVTGLFIHPDGLRNYAGAKVNWNVIAKILEDKILEKYQELKSDYHQFLFSEKVNGMHYESKIFLLKVFKGYDDQIYIKKSKKPHKISKNTYKLSDSLNTLSIEEIEHFQKQVYEVYKTSFREVIQKLKKTALNKSKQTIPSSSEFLESQMSNLASIKEKMNADFSMFDSFKRVETSNNSSIMKKQQNDQSNCQIPIKKTKVQEQILSTYSQFFFINKQIKTNKNKCCLCQKLKIEGKNSTIINKVQGQSQLLIKCQKCQDSYHYTCLFQAIDVKDKNSMNIINKLKFYCPFCQLMKSSQNQKSNISFNSRLWFNLNNQRQKNEVSEIKIPLEIILSNFQSIQFQFITVTQNGYKNYFTDDLKEDQMKQSAESLFIYILRCSCQFQSPLEINSVKMSKQSVSVVINLQQQIQGKVRTHASKCKIHSQQKNSIKLAVKYRPNNSDADSSTKIACCLTINNKLIDIKKQNE